MGINGISGVSGNMQTGHSGGATQMDAVSRSIQKQIENARKQLQELSSNEDMTPEEKIKKKQEIQQEIATLNQQLRQHQIEQRKEQQRESTSMDDMLGSSQEAVKPENGGNGLSQASMQAMISADSSMKLAKTQGSVSAQMEGRAGVLETEIKTDRSRGAGTTRKEEELADVQAKAQAAAKSQFSTLTDAQKAMEEAAKTDSETKDAKDENNTAENEEDSSVAEAIHYTSVDIRL